MDYTCPVCDEHFDLEPPLWFDTEDFPCPICGVMLTVDSDESLDEDGEEFYFFMLERAEK